jgi:CBS domain-containing protein
MKVGDIMSRNVVTVDPEATFADAAKTLHEHGISSVVVRGSKGAAGIVTERDFVNLVADGQNPKTVKIDQRMTKDLAVVQSKTDIADAAKIMAERRIRHLPVVDRGKLVGIISIRDLTSWAVGEVTGGHELPDLERSSAALAAAVEIDRPA